MRFAALVSANAPGAVKAAGGCDKGQTITLTAPVAFARLPSQTHTFVCSVAITDDLRRAK